MAATVAVAAAVALPLLADGAYEDCYNYCFNDCISKDKSMREYCSYACDKTCAPDADADPIVAAGLPINCQVACVRDSCHRRREGGNNLWLRHACMCVCSVYSCTLHTPFSPIWERFQFEYACIYVFNLITCANTAVYDLSDDGKDGYITVRVLSNGWFADGDDMKACYGQCDDRCETKLGLPRPLRAGRGAVRPAALPDHPFHKKKQDIVRPAALPDHPFHKKQQDAVWPAALPDHPFHKKQQDAVWPAALPDHPFHKKKQDAVWPAALPDHPFHKKQHDAVWPAALPDHPFDKKQDVVRPAALPDHPFHKKHDAVRPAGEPDPGDVISPAWGLVRP